MRKIVVLVFAALMVQGTSTAFAQQSSRASLRHPRTATQTRAEKRKARIRATLSKLNQPVEAVDWEDEVLEDLINDFFKGQYGLKNLLFKWKVIENSGANVDLSTAVNLSLADITVGELLDLMMDQLSAEADTPADQLTYHIIGGMIKVSTKADFDRQLHTKTYSIMHLYVARPYWVDAPEIRVDQAGGSGGGGGGGRGGLIDFEEEREERQESLIELLKKVRPESWDDGGGPGTLTAFGDKLVITQTLEMHEIIGGRFAYTKDFYP